ncbi:MAG: hypothetical protein NUW02_03345 [Candidatus Campbellbacteria bacterium]|nr:hypothetical protein [Candidatus Campbellbacteria bacterium]
MFGDILERIQPIWTTSRFLFELAPLWAPILFGYAGWRGWMRYRRAKYLAKQEPVLLEIKVPREVSKSPAAMEMALNSLYSIPGEGNLLEKYWDGGVRAWFSLELVSLEGQVKFFIWTWRNSVKNIQNHIYAQYPKTEVVEVPDYTLAFLYDPDVADLYAAEFILNKPDPYPIKTYIDYGLDRDPKEEFKIDPIAPVLEYLGGLGKGEQAWIQILVRAHKKEDTKEGSFFANFKSVEDVFDIGKKTKEHFEKTDKWKDDVKGEIKKIIDKRTLKGKGKNDDEESTLVTFTSGEKDIVTALERSITKLGFDVGIRGVYVAEKDYFNKSHKGALNGVLTQYNTPHLNGFKKVRGTSFDYIIQDPLKIRLPKMKREMFEAYRLRSYFHAPYKRKPFVLNAEELATIFHFPGGVVETPTFGRIESQKAEPPMNLPV